MRGHAVVIAILGASVYACGGGDHEGQAPPIGSGGAGAGATTSSANGGSASTESSSSGGAGGSDCGNGKVDVGESCDGEDLALQSCASLGFDSGALACKKDCSFDESKCVGVEHCQDGRDNDGDGLADCQDSDCAAACADVCAAPLAVLADPSQAITASSIGHATGAPLSCSTTGTPGPELVYSFTPATTGALQLSVVSSFDVDIGVRTACDDAATEIGCRPLALDNQPFMVAVTAGVPLYVVVAGDDTVDRGALFVNAASRPIVCGDGFLDPGEQCDDANTDSGDGCSSTCQLEPTEVEPNDSVASANAFDPSTDLFIASIDPAGDVDVLSFDLPAGASNVDVETSDLGEGGCSLLTVDTQLDFLASDGTTVLASDDDGGDGTCSRVSVQSLAPGTYYVRVSAPSGTNTPTFPYSLTVSVTP